MKKLIVVWLMLLLTACAYAETDTYADVGPYTFDTDRCTYYTYQGQKTLFAMFGLADKSTLLAEYSWGEIYIQYMTFREAGMPDEEFTLYHGAYDDWQRAEACIDIWYGEDSNDGYLYTGYVLEDVDLVYYPACRVFSTDILSGYGGGSMTGAVFIDKNGILFLECWPYYDTVDAMGSLENALSKLLYKGKSVCNPEAAQEAYASRPVKPETDPILTFGDSLHFDSSDCTGYKKTSDTHCFAVYGDFCADIWYIPADELFSEEVPDSTHYQIAKNVYYNYVDTGYGFFSHTLKNTAEYDDHTVLRYDFKYEPADAAPFNIAGAIYADAHGALIIEVYTIYGEGNTAEIIAERDRIMEYAGHTPTDQTSASPAGCTYSGREMQIPEGWTLIENSDTALAFECNSALAAINAVPAEESLISSYIISPADALRTNLFYSFSAIGLNPRTAVSSEFSMANGEPLVVMDIDASAKMAGVRYAHAAFLDGAYIHYIAVWYTDITTDEAVELVWQAVDMYFGKPMAAAISPNETLFEYK